ncbi:DUF4192 domain-containing protein [Nocardioides ultimimeridianus]
MTNSSHSSHPSPTSPASTPDPVRQMTARSPEDLLALAPVLLGFWPGEDAVMLTFATARPFHARLSLPDRASPRALRDLEEKLLGPARRHGVGAAVFLVFGRDERVARAVCLTLRRGALRAGIDVIACIWADGERYRLLAGSPDSDQDPVAYDLSDHPFVLEAMVEGRLTHASREDMVAALEPDPQACAEVAAALERLGLSDTPGPDSQVEVRRAVRWTERIVRGYVADQEPLDAEQVARLVWTVQAVPARDAAWGLIDRRSAVQHRAFWAQVLPRTPEHLVPPVADLLGFAAWQAGDGAQAWAAVDRAQRADPEDSMAGLLAGLLEGAVPPDAWSA